MGNDPSKASRSSGGADDDNDGPIRIGGGRTGGGGGGGGAGAGAGASAALSRSHSFTTLDGHSPYIPDRSASGSPTPLHQQQQQQGPQLSFDEDRRTDLHYSSLDESYSTPSTPSSNASSSNDGPISIGGGRRNNDIVQVNRTTNEEEMEAAALHPEVEAILNLAQFYPADPSYQSRVSAPADAVNITPVLIRPRMVMDVYSSLQHRWTGVGQHCLRSQIMIGKEMDKLEHAIQATIPAVQHRNTQLRLLNEQLQQCQ
jgi:hypothetical protein